MTTLLNDMVGLCLRSIGIRLRYVSLGFTLLPFASLVWYQIQRGGATLQARLIQLLTEGTSSPNPRWLIRLGSKDEEVYEHIFVGKVNHDLGDDEQVRQSPVSSSSMEQPPVAETAETRLKRKKDDTSMNSDSSARASKQPKADKADASSREARSRRRQEKGSDEATPPMVPVKQLLKQETMETLSSAVTDSRKRKTNGGKRETAAKSAKAAAVSGIKKEEEECLKIKFLTGTLYLYRGRHRRAEFVRRV
jgi:hypothetical protein